MRTAAFLLLLAVPAAAAPVPKSLKPKPPTADGVWEWVEFVGDNGKMVYTIPKPSYRRIAGDRMSTGKSSVAELLAQQPEHTVRPRDPDRPGLYTFEVGRTKYSAAMEVDGDTLRWAYATNPNQTITECKPADGVYYYVFQRVRLDE